MNARKDAEIPVLTIGSGRKKVVITMKKSKKEKFDRLVNQAAEGKRRSERAKIRP
jgi:predicted polyphosphate/ATP-dependent NAD kinase